MCSLLSRGGDGDVVFHCSCDPEVVNLPCRWADFLKCLDLRDTPGEVGEFDDIAAVRIGDCVETMLTIHAERLFKSMVRHRRVFALNDRDPVPGTTV